MLVDNLRINHNAIIDGIIPKKVPYGQLLAVCKGLLGRGDGMKYFSHLQKRFIFIKRNSNYLRQLFQQVLS